MWASLPWSIRAMVTSLDDGGRQCGLLEPQQRVSDFGPPPVAVPLETVAGGGPETGTSQPASQVWHTDLMYLWISGRWYFSMAALDGFSRRPLGGFSNQGMNRTPVTGQQSPILTDDGGSL
jgi:transposase InsO family protein